MSKPRGSSLALLAAVTIFVSAFLLFQVQPVISKKILPWFGGSPAVWTTCMLFFQVLLLAGYSYAHLLTRCVSPLWQGRVHAGLLVIAVCTLPIVPGNEWKPADGTWPEWRILAVLAAKVGAPYFLLSTTGPLVQAWFALAYPGRSPYRLYALSNVGSLGALLSYPFMIEPAFAVDTQGLFWSAAFVGFALLAGGMGIWIWRIAAGLDQQIHQTGTTSAGESGPPRWHEQVGWLLLAALPSMTFLAVTHHLCQDVAPVPLLFIVPLSLYLLSLIICFDREAWYSRLFFGFTGALTLGLLCALERSADLDRTLRMVQGRVGLGGKYFPITFSGTMDAVFAQIAKATGGEPFTVGGFEYDVKLQTVMYLSALFLGCMLCHGELVKSKPAPRYLTQYYLLISAGGALGGIFVGLISPALFVTPYELPLGIVGCFGVAMLALFHFGRRTLLINRELLQWSAAFVGAGCLVFVLAAQFVPSDSDSKNVIAKWRNFYGVIEVRRQEYQEDGETPLREPGYALFHGRILHGFQYQGELADEITTYYGPNSGPGLALRYFPGRSEGRPLNVAVVGLGTGTMAGFAQQGDYFCFYEIDPKIKRLHDERIFTYLSRARDRGATVDVLLGDARLTMERQAQEERSKRQQYDIIVLDAFSGDAIPVHLLNREAMGVYDQLLSKDDQGRTTGILVVHISNRYINLAPVVDGLRRTYNYEDVPVDSSEEKEKDASSNWVLLTQNAEFLNEPIIRAAQIEHMTQSWKVLAPSGFGSESQAEGDMLNEDGSILVSGTVPDRDTYVVEFETELIDILGFRIEVLRDERLPGGGPGRGDSANPGFLLSEFSVTVEQDEKPGEPITFEEATADVSPAGLEAYNAVDGNPQTGWGIDSASDEELQATFMIAEPIPGGKGCKLTVRLEQNGGGGTTIGRFRISALAKRRPVYWTDQFSSLREILE